MSGGNQLTFKKRSSLSALGMAGVALCHGPFCLFKAGTIRGPHVTLFVLFEVLAYYRRKSSRIGLKY